MISSHHQPGTFVTTEPILTYHNHFRWLWSSQLTLGFTLGVMQSVGLDKSVMACIHHFTITQSSFTVLKIPCPPIYPSHSGRMLCFGTSSQVACSLIEGTQRLELEIVSFLYHLLLNNPGSTVWTSLGLVFPSLKYYFGLIGMVFVRVIYKQTGII